MTAIVTVCCALITLMIAIITIIVKLNNTLTKLNITIDVLSKQMEDSSADRKAIHLLIKDHEIRLVKLEENCLKMGGKL